jgi:endonuclease/exonuclease/phosphatase (EEP) superfamily protein YafD
MRFRPPATPSRQRWLDRLAASGVIAISIALLLGELGRLNWLFDMSSHFLVQYFLALAVAGTYLLLRRRWLWCMATVMRWLVGMADRALPAQSPAAVAATADSHRLRIATINVHAGSDYYIVQAEIERSDPDIISTGKRRSVGGCVVADAIPMWSMASRRRCFRSSCSAAFLCRTPRSSSCRNPADSRLSRRMSAAKEKVTMQPASTSSAFIPRRRSPRILLQSAMRRCGLCPL